MRRSPLLLLAALFAVLALLAGCSSDDGADDGEGDSGETTTTTVPEREPGAPASEASPDEIRSWLPGDDVLGGGYTRLSAEEESAASQGAESAGIQATLDEACPPLAQLGLVGSQENSDEISATYVAEDRREIRLSIDPTPTAFAEDDVAPLVEAINECGEVSLESGGVSVTMTMSAEEIDDHGDHGMSVQMATEFDYLGAPVTVDYEGIAFSVEGLVVKLTARGGLGADDEGGPVPVPADTELLAELADQLGETIVG